MSLKSVRTVGDVGLAGRGALTLASAVGRRAAGLSSGSVLFRRPSRSSCRCLPVRACCRRAATTCKKPLNARNSLGTCSRSITVCGYSRGAERSGCKALPGGN